MRLLFGISSLLVVLTATASAESITKIRKGIDETGAEVINLSFGGEAAKTIYERLQVPELEGFGGFAGETLRRGQNISCVKSKVPINAQNPEGAGSELVKYVYKCTTGSIMENGAIQLSRE